MTETDQRSLAELKDRQSSLAQELTALGEEIRQFEQRIKLAALQSGAPIAIDAPSPTPDPCIAPYRRRRWRDPSSHSIVPASPF